MPHAPRAQRVARPRLAVMERNLERYPWALLDSGSDETQLEFLIESAGEEGRAWRVHAAAGMPGPFDADVYVAMCERFNSLGKPDDGVVEVTFSELVELMRRERAGKMYRAIDDAIHRIGRSTIEAVQTFRSGDVYLRRETVQIWRPLTDRYRNPRATWFARVVLAPILVESIKGGFFRLLNTDIYFNLGLPTSRRLYRYLDMAQYRGKEQLEELEIPLTDLARRLPINRGKRPSHIKRTLDPAHKELLEAGIVHDVRYVEHVRPGRVRPRVSVRYRMGNGVPVEAPKAKSVALPDERAELARECARLLDDAGSLPWYIKVANRVPDEMIRGVLGACKEMLTEGYQSDVARKTFTATIRIRAKNAGIEL